MNKPLSQKGKIDFPLFIVIFLLTSMGVVLIGSASYNSALWTKGDGFFYLKRQMIWTILGWIFMILSINYNYIQYKKHTKLIMGITTILLFAVFAFKPVNYAQRWINLGFASFQPSEIAKYTIVLYMAQSIEKKGERMKTFKFGVLPYIITSGAYAALILKEKNLSIAAVIMIVTIILLFASGARMKDVLLVCGMVAAGGVFFTISESYRLKRLMSFRQPWKDPANTGYQLIQSLLSLGAGGLLGVGFTKSRQKNFMPEAHNDFIFSVIGEELGLIGCVFIIILFIIFIWRGIQIALKAKDVYGSMVAIGITAVIGVQAVINIAVATGSMPVTGVPLPFISYGGSSLVFNMFAVGILLNISRYSQN